MGSDRSYFQCPHCQKRYAASARARAADGKRIHCKQCHETFTLTIVSDYKPPSPKPATKPITSHQPPKKTAPKPQATPPKKRGKKSRLQIGTLLIVLSVVVASGWWWWFGGPDQGVVERSQHAPNAENEKKKAVDDTKLPSAKEVKEMTQEVPPPDPSTLNFEVSSACREVAAAQWMNDYTMTHTRFKQREFVRLLDQSIGLTARVHKQCQNDILLRSVIESAKMGKKPVWLAPLINALITPEYDSSRIVNDEGF